MLHINDLNLDNFLTDEKSYENTLIYCCIQNYMPSKAFTYYFR